jgi:nucleotide-binding universal stress UspA family protein
MKKILVPIDGSAPSINAAKQALELADKYGSEITFMTVVQIDGEILYGDMSTMVNVDYASLSDTLIKLKKDRQTLMLDSVLETLNCTGIHTEKRVIIGNAHPDIVETAKLGDFDLIVMGHRGLNPLKRLFLGSVAKRVLEDAPCSVLIVK